jgi:hypothetical protein
MTYFRFSKTACVVIAALLLTALLFSACQSAPASTKPYEPSLAKDFSVGGVKWGAAYDEVKTMLGDAEELENGMRLSKKGVEFFGQKADLDYFFGDVDGEMRLCTVAVKFEKDFDKAAVVEGVSGVLGEIDKTVLSANGDVLAVEEPLWKWHDEETVGTKYMHTAAFSEDLFTGRPVLEFNYNGLWS